MSKAFINSMKTHTHNHHPLYLSQMSLAPLEATLIAAFAAALVTWLALVAATVYQTWYASLAIAPAVTETVSGVGLETMEPQPGQPVARFSQFDPADAVNTVTPAEAMAQNPEDLPLPRH